MIRKIFSHVRGVWSRYLLRWRQIRAAYFMLLMLALFTVLTAFVHARGVFMVDDQVSQFVQRLQSPLADIFFNTLSGMGTIGFLAVVAAGSGAALWFLGQHKAAGLALLSLLAYPLNVAIKDFVERARPHSTLIHILAPETGYSFPSGHAMISFTVYGSAAYLLWAHIQGSGRGWLIAGATLLTFFISLSRIYLGVHWFSDVLGGWLAGAVLLLGIIELHRFLVPKAEPQVQAELLKIS